MAVLEKIRVKMGLFITLIIGIALLSFIIDADTFRSAISLFSNKYDVGQINGKSISYQDFQKRIEYYTNIHQLLSGAGSIDEQSSDAINQNAWQELLSENVIIPTIKLAGVAVGQEELFDMTQGGAISPVLEREQIFIGEEGIFDREMVAQFVRAIATDESGNLALYWSYLEKNMVTEQMVSKYLTLLSKSTIQNSTQLRRSIDENNITSQISFVVKPFGFDIDTTVAVSKQEIRDYYNRHKENYKQKAGRDIEYVLFEVTPSERDIEIAESDIEKLMEEFSTTKNLKNFLARNSDRAFDSNYYKRGELLQLSERLDSFAFSANLNSLLTPYKEESTFRAARINSIRELPDSLFIQHILVANQDRAESGRVVDSLLNLLSKGANFSTLAAENSMDQNPYVENAGDIGWMTQSTTIPGFDTCFVIPVGKPIKLETQYGTHIVKVKERTKLHKKVQLAVLEKEAIASRETFQKYYSQANELASMVDGNLEKFNEITQEKNYYPLAAYNIEEGARNVANYSNAREISRWVYGAKKGDVSQIISIDNKYFFIVALTEVREEGVPPLAQVESEIALLLRREKSNEKMVAQVREQVKGMSDLEEIAETLQTSVSRQSGLSFGAPGSRSFDPKLVGAVAGAEENQLVGPFAGNIGVYLFRVDSRDIGSFFTEDDAKKQQERAFTYQVQALPDIFNKMGRVVDNRAKFF